MTLFLIVALLITVAAMTFALQNAISVAVTFFAWKFEGSLALVLLVTFCVGVIAGLLITIPARIRRTRMISSQKRKIEELEQSLYAKADRGDEPALPSAHGVDRMGGFEQ